MDVQDQLLLYILYKLYHLKKLIANNIIMGNKTHLFQC